jgi:hypothetical protein
MWKCNSLAEENGVQGSYIISIGEKTEAFIASLVHSHPTKTHCRRTDDHRKQKERRMTHRFHFNVNGEHVKVSGLLYENT